MAKLAYRVLYNQDSTNLFHCTKEPLEARHVERMVDEVAGGGADLMLINPNAQRVNYPSRAWQTFWDGYAPGKAEFFGPVPATELPGREHWVSQMKRLADSGCDYLAHALARCRQRGIAPGVTVRMNDMHDVPWPGSHLFSRFYMEHPELRLANGPVSSWSGTGLNYRHAAVREHYLALIRELAGRYDFDVLELDFLRFSSYFPRDEFQRNCRIMTGFVGEVRGILDATGRPIALVPRVAATPSAALELGFDVSAWAHQGLVQGITAGAFLNTAWEMPIDEFRAQVGDNVSIYACTDYTADRRDGLRPRLLPMEREIMRGFAAGYLAAGTDGICFFNFFCAREDETPADPSFDTFAELHSLEGLRGKPKTYLIKAGTSLSETDGPCQVPVPIAQHQVREFGLLLAAEPATARVEARLVFDASGDVPAESLWLQINSATAGPARRIKDGPAGEKVKARTAVFAVPAGALRDGRNRLTLRNEGEVLTVLGLDVNVGGT